MPQFTPGTSGNPRGRPRGVKNRSIGVRKAMTDLLEREGPSLMRVAKRLAKEGDTTMLVALLDRMVPKVKPVQIVTGAPVHPDLTDAENRDQIMLAISEGRLSIDDGVALLGALRLEDAGKKSGILAITLNLNGELPTKPVLVIENDEPSPVRPAFAIDQDSDGDAT